MSVINRFSSIFSLKQRHHPKFFQLITLILALAAPALHATTEDAQAIALGDSVKWTYQHSASGYFSSMTLGGDGTIYQILSSHTLIAIATDGKHLWTYQGKSGLYGRPVVGYDGWIYVVGYKGLYAFGTDGRLKWLNTTFNDFVSNSITIAPDSTLYIKRRNNNVVALDKLGNTLREFDFANSPTVNQNNILFGTTYEETADGFRYVLKSVKANSDEIWRYELGENQTASSNVVIGKDGMLIIAVQGQHNHSNKAHLYAVSADGELLWKHDFRERIYYPPVVAKDGSVYVYHNGKVVAFSAQGEALWTFIENGIDAISGLALAANGSLYFSYSQHGIGYFLINLDRDGKPVSKIKTKSSGTPLIDNHGTLYYGDDRGELVALNTNNGGLADSYWPTPRNNLRATGAIDPDSDRDGLPDSWEIKNGLEPDNINDADLDKDSDGHSNLEEFVAGSNIADASSLPDLNPHFRFHLTPHSKIYKTGAVSPSDLLISSSTGGHSTFDKRGASASFGRRYSYSLTDLSISKSGIVYRGIDEGRFVATNLTYEELWIFEGSEGDNFTSGPLFGVDGQIYAATQSGVVHALTLDGTLVWQTAIGVIGESNPVMSGEGTLYLGSEDNHLYALDRQGNIKWQFETQDKIQASASLSHTGTIYVGSLDGNLYAVNADGTLHWQYEVGHAINLGATIDVDGTIYFGAADGYLYALNNEGNLKWRYQTQSDGLTTPAIDANGTIYFAASSGMFHAIDRDGNMLWQQVIGSSLSDNPILNNDGMLYIANGEGVLLGFDTLSTGPADSAWPMSGQNPGKTRTLITPGSDSDFDGIVDGFDNCPLDSNADQKNFDADTYNGSNGGGDACDIDDDNDGVIDVIDPFPKNPEEWVDTDSDGTGNNADEDDDGDQLLDTWEHKHGLDSLSPQDKNDDADGDGFTNFEEFLNGTSPLDSQSKPVNGMLRWQLALPNGPAFEMITGHNGHSYLIDKENQLFAIDQRGTIKWQQTLSMPAVDKPVIDSEGRIFVVTSSASHTSSTSALLAYSPEGEMLWRYEQTDRRLMRPSITSNGTLVFYDSHLFLHALDNQGNKLWQFDQSGDLEFSWLEPLPPVITADNTIYIVALDQRLFALSEQGTVIWQHNLPVKHWSISSMVLDGRGNVYFTEGSKLFALSWAGNLRWTALAPNNYELDGNLVIDEKDNLKVYWKPKYSGENVAQSYSLDGQLIDENMPLTPFSNRYIDDNNNMVTFGNTEVGQGEIHITDAQNKQHWRSNIAGLAHSSVPSSDDTILMVSVDGLLSAFITDTGPSTTSPWPMLDGTAQNTNQASLLPQQGDQDNDGIANGEDNCPRHYNPAQLNTDGADDGGNACDRDDDNDGHFDTVDAFALDADEYLDSDSDGLADGVDNDDDGDGVTDANDAFPLDSSENKDTDNDGIGDIKDTDGDNDGMSDSFEQRYGFDPLNSSDAQQDSDGDGYSNLQEFNAGTSPIDASDNPGSNNRSIWRYELQVEDPFDYYNVVKLSLNKNNQLHMTDGNKNFWIINEDGSLANQWKEERVTSSLGPIVDDEGTMYYPSYYEGTRAYLPNGQLKWAFDPEGNTGTRIAMGHSGRVYVAGYKPLVYALNSGGEQIWQFETKASISMNPVVGADDTVYVIDQWNNFYAIDNDGKEKWQFHIDNGSTLSIGADGTLYSTGSWGELKAFSSEGELKWQYTVGENFQDNVVISGDGTIYLVTASGNAMAINSEGTLRWKTQINGTTAHPPVLGDDGSIYISTVQNKVFALHPDGRFNWQYQGQRPFISNLVLGSNGTAYILSDESIVHAIKTSSSGMALAPWPAERQNASRTGAAVVFEPTGDIDGDGHNNANDNCPWAANNDQLDSDEDKAGDMCDIDNDNDDMPDYWELQYGLNPLDAQDATTDIDHDGFNNLAEYTNNTIADDADSKPYPQAGEQVWQYETEQSNKLGTAQGNDGTIYHTIGDYFSDSHSMIALSSQGIKKWQVLLGGTAIAKPVIGKSGTIYQAVKSTSDTTLGFIIALNNQGIELGRHQLKQPGIKGLSIGSGETLYYTDGSAILHAIDGIGRQKWQLSLGKTSNSLPIIASDGTVYLTVNKKLIAISPQGKEKWQINPSNKTFNDNISIDSLGRIYVNASSTLYAYNPDGTLAWQHDDDGLNDIRYTLIGADGTIYRVSGGGVIAVDANGTGLWQRAIDSVRGIVLGKNDHLYVLHDTQQLSAITPQGHLKWQQQLAFEINNKNAYTMDQDGVLYVADESKSIFAIKTGSGGVANSAWPMQTQNNQNTNQVSYRASSENDVDGDGIANDIDNCPLNFNPAQLDFDGDADTNGGDSCDNDDDNDGVIDILDAFEFDATESLDTDGDGLGNNVDTDDDGDQYPDDIDQMPFDSTEHLDTDGDGIGNNADPDDDGDSMSDSFEQANGLDSTDASDATADSDGDGFTNLEEFLAQTDANDPNNYPQGPGTVKWSYTTESSSYAYGATLLDNEGLLYVPNNRGEILVLDGQGELLRSMEASDRGILNTVWPGVMDAQNNLYFIDRNGHFVSLDSQGIKRWKQFAGTPNSFTSSITLGPDNTLYVGTEKGSVKLYTLQGKLLKTIEINKDKALFGRIMVQPDGGFYATDESGLVAIDSQGTKRWHREMSVSNNQKREIHLAPGTKNEIYLSTPEGFVYAIDPQGKQIWSFDFGSTQSPKTVSETGFVVGNNGAVYFGTSDGRVIALTNTGKPLWRNQLNDSVRVNNILLGLDGIVYVSQRNVGVVALNAIGEVAWQYNADSDFGNELSLSDDGVLYVTSGNYQKIALALNTSSAGLAQSPWPVAGFNSQRTGYIATNLDSNDFDGDNITNALDNCPWVANTHQLNHASLDDEGDVCDFDDDNDGMADTWEIHYGLNPLSSADGIIDADGDGYSNFNEFESNTNPHDRYSMPQQLSTPQSLFTVRHGSFTGEMVMDNDGVIYAYLEKFGDNNKNTLVAIDNTGQLIWNVTLEQTVVSHPVIDNQGNILCTTENGVIYAVDNTGQLLWTNDLNTSLTHPASIGPDDTIYQSTRKGQLFALSNKGKEQWQWDSKSGSLSKPVVSLSNQIIVASINGLHALSNDGQEQWQFEYDSGNYQAPAIDSFGNIYHTTNANILSLTANGKLRWQYNAKDKIIYSPIIDEQGQIYIITGSDYRSRRHALNRYGQLRWISTKSNLVTSGYTLTNEGYLFLSDSYHYSYIGHDGSVKLFESSSRRSNVIIGANNTFYFYDGNNYLHAYKLDGVSTNEGTWYTRGGSFARNGLMKLADFDGDGFADSTENCPYIANPDQLNSDGADDGGDACDFDDDNDGVLDMNDAFALDASESVDTDNDGIGNNADTDDDNDGVEDVNDEYPLDPSQTSFALIAGLAFSDANLAACVLDAATSNEWTTVDQLTSLSCVSQNISDLSGLEQLIGLTQLDLRRNTISDIQPLADLTALTLVKLSKNNVQDITWLANLSALTFLSLSENNFDPSQVSSLANLTNLATLYLNGNQIIDISPLVDLTNLTRLYLYDNQIVDVSWLAQMNQIRTLRLEKNQITDITTLSDLTTLNLLDLRQNQVNEIESITELTKLTILKLSKNELTDIQTLANFKALKFLSLSGNQFDQSTLDVLSDLTSLNTLYLRNSQIVDISPLARLTALTRLYLKDNQIEDLSMLSNLTGLNILQLTNNQIATISVLLNMTNARNIDLRGNSEISCAELDVLDETLGAGIVRRPDTCGE